MTDNDLIDCQWTSIKTAVTTVRANYLRSMHFSIDIKTNVLSFFANIPVRCESSNFNSILNFVLNSYLTLGVTTQLRNEYLAGEE